MNSELQKDFDVNNLNDGIIWIKGEITEDYGMDLVQQFQHLLNQLELDVITVFIDSCGGDCDQGFAIVDMIEYAKSHGIKVNTVGICASSIASVILFSGSKGYRFAFPSARIMVHKPYWETDNELDDKKTLGWEIGIATRKYKDIMIKNSSMTREEVNKMLEKDFYMSAEQALERKLIDHAEVLGAKTKIKKVK